MLYKVELNQSIFKFVKSIELDRLKFSNKHTWISRKIEEVLTEEGINWFESNGIILCPYALLFRIDANHIGAVHNDGIDYAINFVISGQGTMEWIDVIEGDQFESHYQGLNYISFSNIKDFRIKDSWSGKLALVRVNYPHRVVAGDSERYCLSIRATSPKTFNDALEKLYTKYIPR